MTEKEVEIKRKMKTDKNEKPLTVHIIYGSKKLSDCMQEILQNHRAE